MDKTVIINSFHFQSIPILEEHSPEAIISFDSHFVDFVNLLRFRCFSYYFANIIAIMDKIMPIQPMDWENIIRRFITFTHP